MKALTEIAEILNDGTPNTKLARIEWVLEKYKDGAAAELTFQNLALINLKRCNRWHPAGLHSWTVADWGIAMGGEA